MPPLSDFVQSLFILSIAVVIDHITAPAGAIGELRLVVNNSGPAALDSNMKFAAQILQSDGLPAPEAYLYVWKHNAAEFPHTDFTEGDDNAWLLKEFNSIRGAEAGGYTMDVKVFSLSANQSFDPPLVTGQSHFNLTDHLNLDLEVEQVIPVQLRPSVFATFKNITLTANVMDNFTNAKFNYSWRHDHSVISNTTSDNTLAVLFERPGEVWLEVNTTAMYNLTIFDDSVIVYTTSRHGSVIKNIFLKDAVSNLIFEGDNTIEPNQTFKGNISFNGSAPFILCTSITGPKVSNTSCSYEMLNTVVPWSHQLETPGNYTLHVMLTNDVSEQNITVNITVAPIGPPNTHISAVVVTASVFITIIILTTLAYSYYSDRRKARKETLETADFEFHPFVSSGQTTVKYIKRKFSDFYSSSQEKTRRFIKRAKCRLKLGGPVRTTQVQVGDDEEYEDIEDSLTGQQTPILSTHALQYGSTTYAHGNL